MSHHIKIGCCGFPVSKKKYFESFSVVEIQQTFYQPPDLSLAKKWRMESPDDFEYTLKAWQLITHEPKSPTYKKLKMEIAKEKEKNYGSFKWTEEVQMAWEKTKEIADALDARIIVFQCPASFEPTDENKKNIKRFFSNIKRERFVFAWEPRGRWLPEDIGPTCKELDLVHVADPFYGHSTYGKIPYYRLHGKGGYGYKYTEDDIRRLKDFARWKRDSYFMFNNVYMFEDAMAFKELIYGL
jgi:uncharacterized protein YecE (DUF72 family)